LDTLQHMRALQVPNGLACPIRLITVSPMGTQHCGSRWGRTKYAEDASLQVRVNLLPFRGEPETPSRELLEFATVEEAKGVFVGCSFITDIMD
jgi:hypothetical protein